MEKRNEFQTTLENGVQEDVRNNIKLEVLQKELDELQALVIKTPEQEKRIKFLLKEINDINGKNPEEKAQDKSEEKKDVLDKKIDIKKANYDQLLARRQEIKLALEEINKSAVIDVAKRENLEKELKEIEAALLVMEMGELEAKENVEKAPEDEQTKEEKQEEAKEKIEDEENLNGAKKVAEKEEQLKQAYREAMLKYYAIREVNQRKLNADKTRLVSRPDEYLKEINAEVAMYNARDNCLKVMGKDPFEAERQVLREQEKKNQKDTTQRLDDQVAEYRELEIKLERLDKIRREQAEENHKAIKGGATQKQIDKLNEELAETDSKLNQVKQDLIKSKDKLSESMEILENRKERRQALSLETREFNAQSKVEQANIKYASSKEGIRRNDYSEAKKSETKHIKEEVERNEARVEKLKRELKDVKEKEPDNFKKRLSLLEDLDDASQQLEVSRETQKDIDRGIEPETDEAIREVEKDYKSSEERKEDFKKDAEELIQKIEEKEKEEGELAVQDPTGLTAEAIEEKKEEVVASAIAVPAVMGKDSSVIEAAVVGEKLAKESIPPEGAPCSIAELNNPNLYNVINPDDPKAAEEYVKLVEEAEKDNEELNKIEYHVMDEIE